MGHLSLSEIEKNIGYKFSNSHLLKEAVTHPSMNSRGQSKSGAFNYERLEFLGDSILCTVISTYIFQKFPEENEGSLAKRREALVCGTTLTEISASLNLGQALIMTKGEQTTGGRVNKANLENVLEAVVGAIYLDGGLEVVQKFILKNWKDLVNKMAEPPKDAKTALQEILQADGLDLPKYSVVEQSGPSHAPIFTIEVSIDGYDPVTAKGNSKREAERDAAKIMLQQIKNSR